MKITKQQLKRLIKEEYAQLFDPEPAAADRWFVPSAARERDRRRRSTPTPYEEVAAEGEFMDVGATEMGPYKDIETAIEADPQGTWPGSPGYKGDPGISADRHEASVNPFQALGDAALRGSERALGRLVYTARYKPAAQAILDAVYEENPSLKPHVGLDPSELEAAQLQERKMKITKQQLKKLIKEELSLMELHGMPGPVADPVEELQAAVRAIESHDYDKALSILQGVVTELEGMVDIDPGRGRDVGMPEMDDLGGL